MCVLVNMGFDMKRIILFVITLLMFAVFQDSSACVGRILTIGVSTAENERLLAELVSQLVSERTGSNVKIVQFKTSNEMYAAVRKGEVSVVIENLERGAQMVYKTREKPSRALYESLKKDFQKNYNMVWFEPFGESQFYSPVIAIDVLEILPALPKLVAKLGGALSEDLYSRMLRSIRNGDLASNVAKEFLKSRRLI